MTVHAPLPVTILPAIVTEFRGVPELLFRDVRVPVASLVRKPQAERKAAHCVARNNACLSEMFPGAHPCIPKMIMRIAKQEARQRAFNQRAGRGVVGFECRQINIAINKSLSSQAELDRPLERGVSGP
jgi:hypothetical protein